MLDLGKVQHGVPSGYVGYILSAVPLNISVAEVVYRVAGDVSGHAVVRVDTVVGWTKPRPADEFASVRDRVVILTVVHFESHKPGKRVVTADPKLVEPIVNSFNHLTVNPPPGPLGFGECGGAGPTDGTVTYQVAFAESATATPDVVATVGGECMTVGVTVKGRPAAPLLQGRGDVRDQRGAPAGPGRTPFRLSDNGRTIGVCRACGVLCAEPSTGRNSRFAPIVAPLLMHAPPPRPEHHHADHKLAGPFSPDDDLVMVATTNAADAWVIAEQLKSEGIPAAVFSVGTAGYLSTLQHSEGSRVMVRRADSVEAARTRRRSVRKREHDGTDFRRRARVARREGEGLVGSFERRGRLTPRLTSELFR